MKPSFVPRAALAAVWTLFVWGGRISLLTDSEAADAVTWLRVGGSLLFGIALGVTAVLGWRRGIAPSGAVWLALGFAAWMVFIWVPDVVDLFREERTVGFIAVHLVLAVVSLTLGTILAVWGARRLGAGAPAASST